MQNTCEEDIEKWMPLIKKLAGRFTNRISDFDDLVQEGILALIKALKDYSPNKGRIEGYIRNEIRRGMYNLAINTSFAVHVPSGSLRVVKNVPNLISRLKGENIDFIYEDDCNRLSEDVRKSEDIKCTIIDIRDIISKYDKNNVAYLYFLGGLNYEEISEKVGCNLASISRHINAIKRLIEKKCK